jgi:hypothetical protein
MLIGRLARLICLRRVGLQYRFGEVSGSNNIEMEVEGSAMRELQAKDSGETFNVPVNDTMNQEGGGETEVKKVRGQKDPFLNAKYVKVAMRLAYNGQKYNGFETCEDKHQTHTQAVEDKLFDALEKVTLVRDRKTIEKECNYAKSGRTDAGVSASYNVVSLRVRQVCGRLRSG